jgi:pimeloyl-ACP methyl ester carboxylesterase
MSVEFADISWAGRPVRIEYRRIGFDLPERAARPLLIFLHEGLGSVSMWRDFPERLCEQLNLRGLVFSRPGYGRSTPKPADERWAPDFMHRQAREVLPAFFAAIGVVSDAVPYWLFGHSDGGSIALLHAAEFPERVNGLIVAAPHLFVEDLSIASIEEARVAYETTDLRDKLGRHHADPDSAFRGWNDIWLAPAFRSWNIEAEVAQISCPILAVQGFDDQYGTMAQIERIAALRPGQTELLQLPACGHSPHRDQPEALIGSVGEFMHRHGA